MPLSRPTTARSPLAKCRRADGWRSGLCGCRTPSWRPGMRVETRQRLDPRAQARPARTSRILKSTSTMAISSSFVEVPPTLPRNGSVTPLRPMKASLELPPALTKTTQHSFSNARLQIRLSRKTSSHWGLCERPIGSPSAEVQKVGPDRGSLDQRAVLRGELVSGGAQMTASSHRVSRRWCKSEAHSYRSPHSEERAEGIALARYI